MSRATLRDGCAPTRAWAHDILDRAAFGLPLSDLIIKRALVILGDIK